MHILYAMCKEDDGSYRNPPISFIFYSSLYRLYNAATGKIPIIDLAYTYVLVGEFDKALDKIEYLLSVPSPMSIPLLKLDSRWKPLMSHPRFQKLQEREN